MKAAAPTASSDALAFLRFLVVGGGFALLYAAGTAALIHLAGTPPLPTSALVYAACMPPAFLAQKHFAFAVRQTRPAAFPLYVGTQLLGMGIVSAASGLLASGRFWQDTAVLLAASALAAVVSFLIGRHLTFVQAG
jgi:putative flippase GtrA